MTTQTTELSAKKELLKTLMRCPHRKLEETIPAFRGAMQADPYFTGKACFAMTLDEFNQIRDLAEAGVAFLLTSKEPEHREAGRVLYQGLEPYRAYRVGYFIRKTLTNSPNRQATGAVRDYLRALEASKRRFDGAVKVAGNKLHKLYELYHVKADERAKLILFENKQPEGEVDILDVLRNTADPTEQAAIIVANKIPYRQATSVIRNLTPAIWVALIEVMTVPEAVNARAMIEQSGILADKTIRTMYEDKLSKAATNKKVTATTLGERKSAKGSDERLNTIIKQAEQTKIDTSARISLDTDIYVDCSGSLQQAIELSKRICPRVAALCDGRLRLYCFNETAWKLPYGKGTLEDFQLAFRMIRANGMTSLGSALDMALRTNESAPEQVIIVTDQQENRPPGLVAVYRESGEEMRFIFLNVGQITHTVANALENAGADVAEFEFTTDLNSSGFYSDFDNLTPLLTKGGYTGIIEKIMALELPHRRGH